MNEPQLHDTVLHGDQWLRIVDFSEDRGTKLSDGRWVCASKFVPVTRACWRYEPNPTAPVDEGADLFEELWSMEYCITGDKPKAMAFAREFLDRHAHALAEKIRNSKRLRDYTDDHMGDCNEAADEIDPEVSK